MPAFYLPPVSWFSRVLRGERDNIAAGGVIDLELEACENFHKQTFRNRCRIDSPNGPVVMSVPVDRGNFSPAGKCLMRDVRISSQYDWRRQHRAALETGYFNSPFFEFLWDDFRPVYEKTWTYLMDLDEELIDICLRFLDVRTKPEKGEGAKPSGLRRTTVYGGEVAIPAAGDVPYYQVFSRKHGFIPDLSIVDLIFNEGKEAVLYL